MNPRYPLVAARAGHRCEYCHAPEAIFNFPFEVEHVIPVRRASTDSADNWALSCRSCNLFKRDRVTAEDPETGRQITLFHPRADSWDEHLQIELESARVVGRTPTGRATVECLRMNANAQVAARRQWIRLGLFP